MNGLSLDLRLGLGDSTAGLVSGLRALGLDLELIADYGSALTEGGSPAVLSDPVGYVQGRTGGASDYAEQTDATKRPLLVLGQNGRKAWEFNGFGECFAIPGITLSQLTYVAVIRAGHSIAYRGIFGGNENGAPVLRVNDNGTITFEVGSIANIATAVNSFVNGTWCVVAATFDGATGNIYIDGELKGTGTHVLAEFPAPVNRIGIDNPTGAYRFDGDIAAALIGSTSNSTNRSRAEILLADYYRTYNQQAKWVARKLASETADGMLFRWSAGDDLRIRSGTHTRASLATYTDADGVLRTAPSGVFRSQNYERSPVSGEMVLAPLVEGQATNLLTYSTDLVNAAWSPDGATDQGAVAAPDGTTNARRVTLSGSFGIEGIYQNVETGSASCTNSVWLRADAPCVVRVGGNSYADNADVDCEVSTEWKRFSVPVISTSFFTLRRSAIDAASHTDVTFDWFGPQVEAGGLSSYIATAGSPVTRAADALSFPYTAPPQEMTVYVRAFEKGTARAGVFYRLFNLGDEADAPRLIAAGDGAGSYFSQHLSAAGNVTKFDGPPVAQGDEFEFTTILRGDGAIAWLMSINGGSEVDSAYTDALALNPSWGSNGLFINSTPSGSGAGKVALRDLIIASGTRTLSWFQSRVTPN